MLRVAQTEQCAADDTMVVYASRLSAVPGVRDRVSGKTSRVRKRRFAPEDLR